MLYYNLKILGFILFFTPKTIRTIYANIFSFAMLYIFKKRQNTVLKNLKYCFPKKNVMFYNKILYKCYYHFADVIIDWFRMPYLTNKQFNKKIHINKQSLKILKKNETSIILTAHFGCWEIIIPFMSLLNKKFAILFKKSKNKKFNDFLRCQRNYKNILQISDDDSGFKIMDAIKKNYSIGFANDQRINENGSIADFFKKKHSISKIAAKIHLKTGIPILFCMCIKKNNKYLIEVEEINLLKFSYIKEKNINKINQIYLNKIEKYITKYPEQYFWFHKIFGSKKYE